MVRDWALGRCVADPDAILSLENIRSDLQLAHIPPEGESHMRTDFFAPMQGRFNIVVNPVDIASQAHFFVFGQHKNLTRCALCVRLSRRLRRGLLRER
ncbi:hypothetical protein Plhal304r1_c070g0158761 [Plasmopara halstedii]